MNSTDAIWLLGVLCIIGLCLLIESRTNLVWVKSQNNTIKKENEKLNFLITNLVLSIPQGKPKSIPGKVYADLEGSYKEGFKEGNRLGIEQGKAIGYKFGHEKGREYQILHPDEKIEIKIDET